jgi:crotonobetainyl-CoA:carnitine CoA-transferase CaiB-like acyl-CoA transferase
MLNYVANQGEGKDEIPIPGMPIKFDTSEDPEITQSPKVGEHTSEVLKTICNYSDARIEELGVEDET